VKRWALGLPLRPRQSYGWAFVDQALSSATNFGLVLIAGRQLGPQGLGVVTIGFSAYLLALGFQRQLLTTPLVSSSAALRIEDRSHAIRKGLTIELIGALGATLTLVVLGLILGGDAGRGFLIVAPWLAPALLQDYWRAILFQEKRARAAVANDAAWVLVMSLTVPLAWVFATDWVIAACWGMGSLVGALVGFAQTRALPRSVWPAFSWWRARLWPFGRWLGLEGVIYAVTTSGTVFILYGLLGASDLGGLRAAQSLFAPLSLILPAIALPGLPAVARVLEASASSGPAFRLAIRLSWATGALASLYVAAMVLLGERLMVHAFGTSFSGYADLAWPIGVWQVALAAGAGFGIFLTAQRRGRALVLVRGTGAVATVVFVSLLAWTSGVVGAAWGLALGGAAATVLTVALAARSQRAPRRDDTRPSARKASQAGEPG
jgi:O-antigen/teichoic acid export membrane protein